MRMITREELKDKLERDEHFALVYVLSPQEFEQEHLPGAINILLEELKEKAPELLPNKHQETICYCANFHCTASTSACQTLESLGYTNVVDYEGGLQDWKDAGYPLETSRAEVTP